MTIIQTIIDSIGCAEHNKSQGEPCYVIPSGDSGPFQYSPIGVCNKRAKKYGCFGRISKESLFVRSVRKK